jgi:hypothetical protein
MSHQPEQGNASAAVPLGSTASSGSKASRKRGRTQEEIEQHEEAKRLRREDKRIDIYRKHCLTLHRIWMKILGTPDKDEKVIDSIWSPVIMTSKRLREHTRKMRLEFTVNPPQSLPTSGIRNFVLVTEKFGRMSRVKTSLSSHASSSNPKVSGDLTKILDSYDKERCQILEELGIEAEDALAYGDGDDTKGVADKIGESSEGDIATMERGLWNVGVED